MGEDRYVTHEELESESSTNSGGGNGSEDEESEYEDVSLFVVEPHDATVTGTTEAPGASSSAQRQGSALLIRTQRGRRRQSGPEWSNARRCRRGHPFKLRTRSGARTPATAFCRLVGDQRGWSPPQPMCQGLAYNPRQASRALGAPDFLQSAGVEVRELFRSFNSIFGCFCLFYFFLQHPDVDRSLDRCWTSVRGP
jgi:hypothetical protein